MQRNSHVECVDSYSELRRYQGDSRLIYVGAKNTHGIFLRYAGSEPKTDTNGTCILGLNGVVWERLYDGDVHASWFDGASDSEILQQAINAVLSASKKTIVVSRTYICIDALHRWSCVSFVGEGSISCSSAYKLKVFSKKARNSPPFFFDLEPARHLKQFSNSVAPTVVLVGSSTGVWSPNTIDTAGGVASMLSSRIRQLNPEKEIKFFNRCIGSQTFSNLNSKPSSFPHWYEDRGKDWIETVANLNPDIVYVVMGGNDAEKIQCADLVSATVRIKALPKNPDIVFITQPSVCSDPHPNFSHYGTYASQEGRDYAAGLIRSFALFNDYGLIDGNRMGGIVLDGRDILNTAMRRYRSNILLKNGSYSCEKPSHDFALSLKFVGTISEIDAAFSLTGNPKNPPFVRVGAGGGTTNSGDIVYIRKNSKNCFVFQCFRAGQNYQTIHTEIEFPSESFSLEIVKQGVWFSVSVDGQQDSTRTLIKLITHGGEFYASTRYYGQDNGPWFQVNHINLGEPTQYLPSLTSSEAWGSPNPKAGTSLPNGGNGLNHLSSLGTQAIYGTLIDGDNLRGTAYGSGSYIPEITCQHNLQQVGISGPLLYTRVSDCVSVVGNVVITSAEPGADVVFELSLPVSTEFSEPTDATGILYSKNGSRPYGTLSASLVRGVVVLCCTPLTVEPLTFNLQFSYRLR